MRLIPIECAVEGSFLAKTIFDDEGRILLKEGVQLTNTIIKRIKAIRIYSIYIIDQYSDKEIEDIIKPELRQKAIKQLKDTFFKIEKFIPASNSTITKAQTNTFLRERQAFFDDITTITTQLMDELLSKKNVLINLVDIKSMDNYTYQHSVNVAVLSLILGIRLNLNKLELYDLCIGALLHDIGKILIPKEILFKPDSLTGSEFDLVKQHSAKGFDYTRKITELSAMARVIALQHHERFDGKGYPDKRKGTDIHKFARIVSIADVYDALTSDRSYRRALSPNEALEYIMANGSTQFDYEMVKVFTKVVVPYPEGTLVKLSTGEYAVINEVFQSYPLRPKVKIVKSDIPQRINTVINLVEALDIVICGNEFVI